MKTTLLVGGLVAAGFDASGKFLLTISHSGRGVFETETWERIARNHEIAYPKRVWESALAQLRGRRLKSYASAQSAELFGS